jgi:hypothetical protein
MYAAILIRRSRPDALADQAAAEVLGLYPLDCWDFTTRRMDLSTPASSEGARFKSHCPCCD